MGSRPPVPCAFSMTASSAAAWRSSRAESGSDFQPLLQPLYYIERALGPYADLVKPDSPDLATAIPALLEQNPSAIIMADVGRLPAGVYEPMQRWLANGGTLIRFAGSRLAAAPADDPLVPVLLRQGERAFGGALSWSEPQPLAPLPAHRSLRRPAEPRRRHRDPSGSGRTCA